MTKRALAVAFSLIFASLSRAQTNPETQKPVTNCSTSRSSQMICAIPNLFGPNGLLLLPREVGGAVHLPHFNSSFESGFAPLGSAIGTELTLLPLASPASAFTYTFEQGVPTRTQQSFGPILAERAETIGKGQFYFGVTYQYFTFDALDGVGLGKLPQVFTHDDPELGGYHRDFITTNNSFKLYVNQVTAFATVGVARNVDVSLAVPVLQVRFNGNSDASLHWTVDPSKGVEPHAFPIPTDPNGTDPNDPGTTTRSFRTASSASGVGDLTVRVKAALRQGEHASLGFAADVRFPTGNEENFLGSGAFGIKPFLIASFRSGRWAPHVNAGYQINGNSFLAGDFTGFDPGNVTQPRPATKGHLPNNLFYAVGADVGATRSLTLCFDFLGQNVFGAKIIAPDVFMPLATEVSTPGVTAAAPYATTSVKLGNFDVQTGSAGMKVKLGADFLLTANALFQLNNNGLRARVVPLIGLSYTH